MTDPADSNGPTDGRFPSAGALTVLRDALAAYVRGPHSAVAERPVAAALEALAGEAHAQGLHGERVVLVLKETWNELPEVASIHDRHERQRLLGRLVTLCIDVYYRQR